MQRVNSLLKHINQASVAMVPLLFSSGFLPRVNKYKYDPLPTQINKAAFNALMPKLKVHVDFMSVTDEAMIKYTFFVCMSSGTQIREGLYL